MNRSLLQPRLWTTWPGISRFISNFVVMKNVMDYLAPTDVSAFIYATRFYYAMTESLNAKYMNVEREIVMCQPWIIPVSEHGHPVAAVGDDIYKMIDMFNNPFKYWSKGVLKKRDTFEVLLVAQNKCMVANMPET